MVSRVGNSQGLTFGAITQRAMNNKERWQAKGASAKMDANYFASSNITPCKRWPTYMECQHMPTPTANGSSINCQRVLRQRSPTSSNGCLLLLLFSAVRRKRRTPGSMQQKQFSTIASDKRDQEVQ
jgi:hypothetical protein